MSYGDTNRAFEERLSTNYTTTAISYQWSNAPFKPTPGTAYVAVRNTSGTMRQVSLGPPPQLNRQLGVLSVEIYVPENEGRAQADALLDELIPIFRRAQFSVANSGLIVCEIPRRVLVGPRDGWFQINMDVDYHRDIFQ